MNRWFRHFGLLITALLGSVCVVSSAFAADAWFDTDYKFRKKLTLDSALVSGTTDLTNFTVLIEYTDGDLATTGNGGQVENSSGYDIIFTDVDPSTPSQLDHEIQSYTAA
ncbi:MAG: hypothetical protein K8I00_05095, partial [Candidatus Omnitrophica bacterium]|nr:hypothetical protein [Candidatus Omnitrophota bacterium]